MAKPSLVECVST